MPAENVDPSATELQWHIQNHDIKERLRLRRQLIAQQYNVDFSESPATPIVLKKRVSTAAKIAIAWALGGLGLAAIYGPELIDALKQAAEPSTWELILQDDTSGTVNRLDRDADGLTH